MPDQTVQKSSKKAVVNRHWRLVDADNQSAGRLSSQVAIYLCGKHLPGYSPHLDCGDYVVVINSDKMKISGQKGIQKIYYRHSGYPGGLKSRNLEQMMQADSRRVVTAAVRGMLPKNKLLAIRMKHLFVYQDEQHRHAAQLSKSKGKESN